MKLTVLGSGSLFPTQDRFPPSFLLEYKSTKFLIDCGHSAISRLVENGIDPREIDAMFLSHMHSDHAGDAFNLLHARAVGNMYEAKTTEEITILGPKGVGEAFVRWRSIFWPEPAENHPVKFLEGPTKIRVGGLGVTTFAVDHVPWMKSVGIKVTAAGKSIVYPGDFGSKQDMNALIGFAGGADLLIVESGASKLTPNHVSIHEIERLARSAKVKKVLLMHNRNIPALLEKIEKFTEKREKFLVARDNMVLSV